MSIKSRFDKKVNSACQELLNSGHVEVNQALACKCVDMMHSSSFAPYLNSINTYANNAKADLEADGLHIAMQTGTVFMNNLSSVFRDMMMYYYTLGYFVAVPQQCTDIKHSNVKTIDILHPADYRLFWIRDSITNALKWAVVRTSITDQYARDLMQNRNINIVYNKTMDPDFGRTDFNMLSAGNAIPAMSVNETASVHKSNCNVFTVNGTGFDNFIASIGKFDAVDTGLDRNYHILGTDMNAMVVTFPGLSPEHGIVSSVCKLIPEYTALTASIKADCIQLNNLNDVQYAVTTTIKPKKKNDDLDEEDFSSFTYNDKVTSDAGSGANRIDPASAGMTAYNNRIKETNKNGLGIADMIAQNRNAIDAVSSSLVDNELNPSPSSSKVYVHKDFTIERRNQALRDYYASLEYVSPDIAEYYTSKGIWMVHPGGSLVQLAKKYQDIDLDKRHDMFSRIASSVIDIPHIEPGNNSRKGMTIGNDMINLINISRVTRSFRTTVEILSQVYSKIFDCLYQDVMSAGLFITAFGENTAISALIEFYVLTQSFMEDKNLSDGLKYLNDDYEMIQKTSSLSHSDKEHIKEANKKMSDLLKVIKKLKQLGYNLRQDPETNVWSDNATLESLTNSQTYIENRKKSMKSDYFKKYLESSVKDTKGFNLDKELKFIEEDTKGNNFITVALKTVFDKADSKGRVVVDDDVLDEVGKEEGKYVKKTVRHFMRNYKGWQEFSARLCKEFYKKGALDSSLKKSQKYLIMKIIENSFPGATSRSNWIRSLIPSLTKEYEEAVRVVSKLKIKVNIIDKQMIEDKYHGVSLKIIPAEEVISDSYELYSKSVDPKDKDFIELKKVFDKVIEEGREEYVRQILYGKRQETANIGGDSIPVGALRRGVAATSRTAPSPISSNQQNDKGVAKEPSASKKRSNIDPPLNNSKSKDDAPPRKKHKN